MTTECHIHTPILFRADYSVPFDYSTIPDLAPGDVAPWMMNPAGRGIAMVRLFAESEIAGSTYKWDVEGTFESEAEFYNLVECNCEWLEATSLRLAADDLQRLHEAGHITLASDANRMCDVAYETMRKAA